MGRDDIVKTRQPVRSPAVWRPRDVTDAAQWTYTFTEDERLAIGNAAKLAMERGKTTATVEASDFDFAALRSRINEWVEILSRGRGFVLLRNFPIEQLSPPEVELAYIGLGLQFGTPVGQDADATLLGHVRDERENRTDPSVRLYRTRERQDFHTDGADFVGLLCLSGAKAGGESRIASSYTVYNEILRTRPDLAEVLFEPMPWDRNDEQSHGEDPFFMLPVFHDVAGMPRIFFIGWYIRDSQRHPQAPPLSDAQLEALELIETIANDPEIHIEMDFRPGDIQLISNAKILHSREAFEDPPELDRRRHLLRLWLASHQSPNVDELLRAGIPKRM